MAKFKQEISGMDFGFLLFTAIGNIQAMFFQFLSYNRFRKLKIKEILER